MKDDAYLLIQSLFFFFFFNTVFRFGFFSFFLAFLLPDLPSSWSMEASIISPLFS